MVGFARDEYHRRLQLVEAALEQAGFDALIAYSVRNQPGPVAYLAGYEPDLGMHDVAFFVVVPGARPRYTLLTNAFWDHPEERTWAEVLITSDFGAKLAVLLPGAARRVGIAGYRCFPLPVYRALQAAHPTVSFEDVTALLLEVARVKSPAEIAVMRRSMAMTDAGGRAFLAAVREGANEREIQAEVERALLRAGADRPAFSVQLYSGAQVAVGVGFRQDRIVARGEQVQVDCGALYCGYQTELSRVTTVGRPADGVRAIMEATAQMYEAMLQTVGPGVPVAEVARAAIATARAQGMEPYLYRSPNHAGNFVGHGIGCWYHESPEIHPDAKGTLEATLIGNDGAESPRFPVAELVERLKAAEGVKAVVFDGIVTGRLLDAAVAKGVKVVVGDRIAEGARIPQGLEVRAFKDLS